MKIPVLFIIFNRPETEAVVFERIREYRPDKLYVAADGPRDNKDGEKERCDSARSIIRQVDWPCEVKTLFQDRNLGCGLGVSTAISWFFENEEYGCIVEDDVLPALDFFLFCEEALPRYKDEDRVMLVSSFIPKSPLTESSRTGFSRYANIWGWASWRRAWSFFDLEMQAVRNAPLRKWIGFYGLYLGIYLHYCCRKLYRSFLDSGKWHTWDYQWSFTLFQTNGLSLVPYVNLTKNVGIGIGDGTHYAPDANDPFGKAVIGHLSVPFIFPHTLEPDKTIERWTSRQVIQARIAGIQTRIRRLLRITQS